MDKDGCFSQPSAFVSHPAYRRSPSSLPLFPVKPASVPHSSYQLGLGFSKRGGGERGQSRSRKEGREEHGEAGRGSLVHCPAHLPPPERSPMSKEGRGRARAESSSILVLERGDQSGMWGALIQIEYRGENLRIDRWEN
jgi:hypothetical protein